MSSGGHGGGLPLFHELHEWLEGSNEGAGFIVPAGLLYGLFAAIMLSFFVFAPYQSIQNIRLLILLAPLWMPIVIIRFALWRFVQFRRYDWNLKRNPHVLLEIRIPREVEKTPLAMETVLSHLHLGPGEGTWFKKLWQGRTRHWYSLELVSKGGQIYFYIWTRQDMRRLVETSLYAQYPGIEIIEAEDYSREIHPNRAPHKMFGCEYKKAKIDPYPIRTYVEFYDKPDLKPEYQIDPIGQVLELMGSLGPGEQLWIQIIIRLAKSEKYRGKKNSKGTRYTWIDQGKEEVEGIRQATLTKRTQVDPISGELVETQGFPSPTAIQTETMKAIERNTAKQAYDVGIRAIYSAPPDKYYRSIGALTTNIFKPFASELLNQLKPAPLFSEKFNDFPWEDPTGRRQHHELDELVEFYRRRSYFHPPYRGPWMTMSTEEIATIFHIPSSSVKTPSLPRIPSATSEAPVNLPT